MKKTILSVFLYFIAVFVWEWILGKFIDLEFNINWGIFDFILAGIGLFIADYFAALTVDSKADLAVIIVLLSIIFVSGISVNLSDHPNESFFDALLREYSTLNMVVAAILASYLHRVSLDVNSREFVLSFKLYEQVLNEMGEADVGTYFALLDNYYRVNRRW